MHNSISSTLSMVEGYKAPAKVSPRVATEFLLELVNLKGQDQETLDRFMVSYRIDPRMLDERQQDPGPIARFLGKFADLLPAVPKDLSQEGRVRYWQAALRQAWGVPEFIATKTRHRSREGRELVGTKRREDAEVAWDRRGRLLSCLGFYVFHVDGPDGFYLALQYAYQIVSKMCQCANAFPRPVEGQLVALGDPRGTPDFSRRPKCPLPYFIAKRRGQKFCSDTCALVGQRDANLRWWNKPGRGGKARRAERQKKAKRQRDSKRMRGK